MNSASATQSHIGIHRAMMVIGRGLHLFRDYYGLDVSLLESHLLLRLFPEQQLISKQLALSIDVDKSTVSRALQRLARRKLVSLRRSPSDARAQVVALTALGRRKVEQIDQVGNRIFGYLLAAIPNAQQPRFIQSMSSYADALGAAPEVSRLNECPLRPQMRRLARALGIVTARSAPETLSLFERELLAVLDEGQHEAGMRIAAIAEQLHAAATNVGQVVASLEQSGLVERSVDAQDSRATRARLTARGQAIFSQTIEQIGRSLAERATTLPLKLLEQPAEWLARLAQRCRTTDPVMLPKARELRELHEPDRRLARALYAQQLADRGQLLELPANLFSSDNRTVGVFCDGALLYALEFQATSSHLTALTLFATGDSESEFAALLETAAALAFSAAPHCTQLQLQGDPTLLNSLCGNPRGAPRIIRRPKHASGI